MTLSDRIRARNGHRKYWQDGTGPTSINMLADRAATRLDRLQEALSDLAVYWDVSPNDWQSGRTCQLCGEHADSQEEFKHALDCCLANEE